MITTVVVYSQCGVSSMEEDINVNDEFDKMLTYAIKRYRKILDIMAEM
jgi:hypothetical protein